MPSSTARRIAGGRLVVVDRAPAPFPRAADSPRTKADGTDLRAVATERALSHHPRVAAATAFDDTESCKFALVRVIHRENVVRTVWETPRRARSRTRPTS